MMDLYKVLGVHRNASKEEIKQAFRNLAMQFHPDKHAHSPKHLKDSATLKFKQLSEAYEILIDDRKRADYNIARHGTSSSSRNTTTYRNHNYKGASDGGYGYGYTNNYGRGYSGDYTHNYTAGRGKRAGTILQFESLFQFLNARTFFRTAAIAGVLLSGIYFIDAGVDALWNTKNSGKSLEDALESIKEAKAVKDKRKQVNWKKLARIGKEFEVSRILLKTGIGPWHWCSSQSSSEVEC